jgi:hypothetical protein
MLPALNNQQFVRDAELFQRAFQGKRVSERDECPCMLSVGGKEGVRRVRGEVSERKELSLPVDGKEALIFCAGLHGRSSAGREDRGRDTYVDTN